jgi:hypothetical protein
MAEKIWTQDGFVVEDYNHTEVEIEKLNKYENLLNKYDIESINNFCDEMCLRYDFPIYVLNEEDYIKHSIEGIGNFENNPLEGGFLDPLSGIVVVRQNLNREKYNGGKIFTESYLIHEIAHRNSNNMFIIDDNFTVEHRRGGFITNYNGRKFNLSLEEGFAETQRELYLEKREYKSPLPNKYPLIFDDKFCPIVSNGIRNITTKQSIIRHKEEENKLIFNNWGPASATIKMLFILNPNFKSVFLGDRNDAGYLKRVAKNIDMIEKGLYTRIRAINPLIDMETIELNKHIASLIPNSNISEYFD